MQVRPYANGSVGIKLEDDWEITTLRDALETAIQREVALGKADWASTKDMRRMKNEYVNALRAAAKR